MEFMGLIAGTALGIMAGTALLKVIETNKRIKTLQDELKKGEEALLGLIKKNPEEPTENKETENAG